MLEQQKMRRLEHQKMKLLEQQEWQKHLWWVVGKEVELKLQMSRQKEVEVGQLETLQSCQRKERLKMHKKLEEGEVDMEQVGLEEHTLVEDLELDTPANN